MRFALTSEIRHIVHCIEALRSEYSLIPFALEVKTSFRDVGTLHIRVIDIFGERCLWGSRANYDHQSPKSDCNEIIGVCMYSLPCKRCISHSCKLNEIQRNNGASAANKTVMTLTTQGKFVIRANPILQWEISCPTRLKRIDRIFIKRAILNAQIYDR